MSKKHKSNAAKKPVDQHVEADSLEALQEGLEVTVDASDVVAQAEGEEIVVSAAEEVVAQAEDIHAAVAELELAEAKSEAYAAQAGDATDPADAVGAISDGSEVSGKPARKTKAPAERRVSMTAGESASKVILATLGSSAESYFLLDANDSPDSASLAASMTATLERIDKMDKKSREKAVNLFSSLVKGVLPSVYTVRALMGLVEHEQLTLKGLTDYFMTKWSYSKGTAARQAQEMFALLPVLKVTLRDDARGAPMKINPTSTIWDVLKEKMPTV